MNPLGSLRDPGGRALRRRGVWILALGLAATATPLLILAAVELGYARTLEQAVASLAAEQAETVGMLERVRRGQVAVRQVMLRLSAGAQPFDGEQAARLIHEYREEIATAGDAAQGSPLKPEWDDLEAASDAFTSQALKLLDTPSDAPPETDNLFELQGESMLAMQRLIGASHANVRKEAAAFEARSRQLRNLMFYAIAVCLIAGAGAAIVTIRTSSGVLLELEDRAAELQHVTGLLIEKQEQVARRFSHELHDELGQTLAAVKADIGALEPDADLESGKAEAMVLVDDAIRSVRDLSHLLHPTLLEHLGLPGALHSLADTFGQRTGIEVELRSDLQRRLPDEARTHFYRIAQEALTNVARHSGATRVEMSLSESGGDAILSVRDNGCGLSDVMSSDGLGLKGMQARAMFAGGSLEILSPPGGGVSICVRAPLGKE